MKVTSIKKKYLRADEQAIRNFLLDNDKKPFLFSFPQTIISFLIPTVGVRGQKHVLRSENIDGTDEEDPVTALEWDPLSLDYLLLASTHTGVRLVDTTGITVIMSFTLPSVAAQVHTLAWISSAPGMFVTGGRIIWSVSFKQM